MENEKDLINEMKEIMKECAHFAKIGSCYGCSDVKCVHGRYIELILTGLAAGKGKVPEPKLLILKAEKLLVRKR